MRKSECGMKTWHTFAAKDDRGIILIGRMLIHPVIPHSAFRIKIGSRRAWRRTTPGFFYCISEKKNTFFFGVLMTVTGLIWFSTRPCETSISLYRW